MKHKKHKTDFIWKPLSRRKNFLKRPRSRLLTRHINFMKKKLKKNFRFQHYLRKHFLSQVLRIPYLPPHKFFDFSLYLKRLNVVLFLYSLVRSPSQGSHFVRKGFVSVDGHVIRDPLYLVQWGSTLQLSNTSQKGIHASLIRNPGVVVYLDDVSTLKQMKVLPNYLGRKKEDLAWILNVLRKR